MSENTNPSPVPLLPDMQKMQNDLKAMLVDAAAMADAQSIGSPQPQPIPQPDTAS